MSSFWTASYFSKWGCRCLVFWGFWGFFAQLCVDENVKGDCTRAPAHWLDIAQPRSAPDTTLMLYNWTRFTWGSLETFPPVCSAERFLAGAAAAHQKKKSSSISAPLLSLSVCVSEQTKHFPDIWILKLHVENWLESVIFFFPAFVSTFPLLPLASFELRCLWDELNQLPPESTSTTVKLQRLSSWNGFPSHSRHLCKSKSVMRGRKQQEKQNKTVLQSNWTWKKIRPFQIR